MRWRCRRTPADGGASHLAAQPAVQAHGSRGPPTCLDLPFIGRNRPFITPIIVMGLPKIPRLPDMGNGRKDRDPAAVATRKTLFILRLADPFGASQTPMTAQVTLRAFQTRSFTNRGLGRLYPCAWQGIQASPRGGRAAASQEEAGAGYLNSATQSRQPPHGGHLEAEWDGVWSFPPRTD
ncbi:hypothetical protein GCM10027359_28810 [Marilutibacter aestuarii]